MSLSARAACAPVTLPWWRRVDARQSALLVVLDLFWARSFEKLTTLTFEPSLADRLTGKFFEDPDLDPREVYAALI